MNIRDDLAPIKSCVLFFSFAVKGRLISTTKPADEGKTATSSTSYNGLSTTITNALGHKKTTLTNLPKAL
jgi:hypothetical protein